MKKLRFLTFQVIFAILILAVAFAPGYGFMTQWIFQDFDSYIYVKVLVVSIWWILISLNLPLSMSKFQWMAGIGVLSTIIGTTWKLYDVGSFDVSDQNSWIWFGIIGFGLMLGWLTISSSIYKSYRHIFGVDDSDT